MKDLTESQLSKVSWAGADEADDKLVALGYPPCSDKLKMRLADAIEKELRDIRREARKQES